MSDLFNDLKQLLLGVPWGSPEMTNRVTAYIGSLCKQLGVGIGLSFTPLGDLGLDAASFLPTAEKLAALQKLDVVARHELLREAWKAANGTEPPAGAGFRNWAVDLALEAAYRLRKSD